MAGFVAGDSRLVFHSYFPEDFLRAGDGRQAQFLGGIFSWPGLCSAMACLGSHSYSPEGLLWTLWMLHCSSRRGSSRVVLRGTPGAFVGWVVFCRDRLAGHDVPEAFFV